MNTRDMLDMAVELISELELMYMNKTYLSTSEVELSEKLDSFLSKYYNGDYCAQLY